MLQINYPLTLTTAISDLKSRDLFSDNALALFESYGASDVGALLNLNPLELLLDIKFSKKDLMDLLHFQLSYHELLDCPMLSTAREICHRLHATQTDKVGMPYYLHPERVAARCHTTDEKIVALLHDTIEDTEATTEYLLDKGFSENIVTAVLSVTKRKGESYEDFVARAKQNPIGRQVKIHDLEDNMDITRLDTLSESMTERFRKYLKAYHFLNS